MTQTDGSGLVSFLRGLGERHVVRYVVAYLAAGWAVLEVVGELGDNGIVPPVVFRAALTLLVCGFPGALTVAWFHGAKGRQDVPRIEKWIIGIVTVFALVATGYVVRAFERPASDGIRTTTLSPEQDPTRVAVLYFEPRGGDQAELLAAGLTESLIDQLSGIEGLHVVSRNGSQLFRDPGSRPASDSIGRALQAGTLVDGTVAQADDRVRVTVTMTNPVTGEQFGDPKQIERPRAEIFDLQDQLADTVSVFLRREIGIELGERRLRAGTKSVDAWEMVQRAERAEHDATRSVAVGDLDGAASSLETADSVYGLAATEDPGWVSPVAARGWIAYRRSRLGGMDRAQYEIWIGRGLAFADSALAIDSTDASALELQATLRYWKYLLNLAATPQQSSQLYSQAEAGFRAAILADPNRASALTSLSHLLLNRGDVAEAKMSAMQAYQADPFLENTNLTLWRIFTASWSLGDGIEAQRACEDGVRRFPQDFRFAQCRLMLLALPGQEPDIDAAWPLVDRFASLSPPQVSEVNRHRGLMYMAMGLARASVADPARAGLADSARAVAVRGRTDPTIDPLRESAWLESMVRTMLGDTDEAVRQLSAYLAANPSAMESYRRDAEERELEWYHRPLLDEPQFRTLLGLR
ncbi:MAG: hypothetical protein PVH00_14155 [Gemmatimonadota bacterium]|jgi:TolB-like protein/tetratricopeptide (TPR) repeat protein